MSKEVSAVESNGYHCRTVDRLVSGSALASILCLKRRALFDEEQKVGIGRYLSRFVTQMAKGGISVLKMLLISSIIHAGAPASAHAQFVFNTIDPPGSTFAEAWGINSSGQIVGTVKTSSDTGSGASTGQRAFLRDPNGQFHIFEVPGSSDFTEAQGINDAGLISGVLMDSNLVTHGFFGDFTSFSQIDVPNGKSTWAFGINNSNIIIGNFAGSDGRTHGFFRFKDGTFSQFDVPFTGTTLTYPIAIDSAGITVGVFDGCGGAGISNVIGCAFIAAPAADEHRFSSASTTLARFFPPGTAALAFVVPVTGSVYTVATGVSDAGFIVGLFRGTDSRDHGFIISPPGSSFVGAGAIPMPGFPSGFTFTQIDMPGAAFTDVLGINNSSPPQVVGAFGDSNSIFHAFLGTT